MSSYKVTYFNVPGRAEVVRYLFVLEGQEFEDNRIEGRQWPMMKPKTAFGCLPELTVDGEVFAQTGAIVRYLATKFGMMGKNEREAFDIDVIMCCADDVASAHAFARIEKDENRKSQMTQELKEKLKFWLPKLEGMLCRNNDGEGWFVGDSVTPADIYVSHTLSSLKDAFKTELSACPKLVALRERFMNLPQIAEWVKKTHVQARGPPQGPPRGPPHGHQGGHPGGHPHKK